MKLYPKMRSRKQTKAQDINWMKAQVLNALSLTRRVDDTLRKYNINDEELLTHFRSAKISLTVALAKWNPVIWGKE